MVIRIIACLAIGYLYGCFSTGYFIGKIYKIDLRNYGSGNSGTTNALRTLGPKAGLMTFAGDFLKALIPILLVRFLIFPDIKYIQLLTLYVGLGAVLGHNYPFWLKFRGGKGIAATSGVMAAFDPWIIPFGIPLFFTAVAITKYVSVGSLVIAVLFPVWIAIRYPGEIHMLIVALIFMSLALIKHRSNIKRILNGTENKIGHKVKTDIKTEK